ncbi:MAG: DUF86 domain-containing protein [Bacteroidales bacterium]|nr:DUF86 domain-containing protein [Bacteroidales bacterium]
MRSKVNDSARLTLIFESISNIEKFVEGTDSYELFEQNKILCHAVVYNLQCIGECVYKLSPEFIASHKEFNWDVVKGLRHVLVHDYYSVNMKTIWNIVEKDLPMFKSYLSSITNN